MKRVLNEKENGVIQHTARLLMNIVASKANKIKKRNEATAQEQDRVDLKIVIWGSAVRFISSLLHAMPRNGIQTVSGNIAQDFFKDVEKQLERLNEKVG